MPDFNLVAKIYPALQVPPLGVPRLTVPCALVAPKRMIVVATGQSGFPSIVELPYLLLAARTDIRAAALHGGSSDWVWVTDMPGCYWVVVSVYDVARGHVDSEFRVATLYPRGQFPVPLP